MTNTPATSKYVAEFLGTFFLVFTIGCNIRSGSGLWAAVSIASVLMVAIYALGGISGANFNPAVSFALGLVDTMGGKGMTWGTVAIYAVIQIVAGILAGFGYSALFQGGFALAPAKGFSLIQVGLCEMLYTFMLCFVVLNVAVAKRNSPNEFFGLAIGYVIVAGAYGAGAVSGGCFNPAVAIGIDISSMRFTGWCITYTLCEFMGAALAALLFKVVRPEDFDRNAQAGLASKLVSEFLGTFMLVLTVGLNVLAKSQAGAFSIASSLMSMIYALGNVSGAHFNPAVTIAIFVSGGDNELGLQMLAAYIAVQSLGGVCAGAVYNLIYQSQPVSSFALGPSGKRGWAQVASAEMAFTFVLCFVVLCVAVAKGKTNQPLMFGLAIGSCVTVGGLAIGSISGGSLNPAVSLGIGFAHLIGGGGTMVNALLYTVFEIIGGVAAAGIAKMTHSGDEAFKAGKV